VRVNSSEPLDEMQVLAGSLIVGLRREVGDVDDERVAVPVAARVAMPLADVRGKMRRAGDWNHALPAFIEDRDRAGRLHDLLHAEVRKPAGEASLTESEIFRTVRAIDDAVAHDLRGEVVGRRLAAARRDRPGRHAEAGDVLRSLAGVDVHT